MKIFHYITGEEVKIGDRVREVGREGRVTEIIQPGSDMAISYDYTEGGVRTEMDWNGEIGYAIWEPPDGDCWEDLEFIERSK